MFILYHGGTKIIFSGLNLLTYSALRKHYEGLFDFLENELSVGFGTRPLLCGLRGKKHKFGITFMLRCEVFIHYTLIIIILNFPLSRFILQTDCQSCHAGDT